MKLPQFLQGRPLVYWIYDGSERLIYVGHTCNVQQRFVDHRANQWWWSIASRVSFKLHPTREAARAAESVAIQEDQPLFNTAHTGRPVRSFDHWTIEDVEVCGLWQLATWDRAYLPPVPKYLKRRSKAAA